MPRYKCGNCGDEKADLFSSCKCCGEKDIFIEYLAYKSLEDENLSVKTEIVPEKLTKLENEKFTLTQIVSKLELQIKTNKSILDKKTSDLELKNKELESKLESGAIIRNSLLGIASIFIVGLGILYFNQYQTAKNLEEKRLSDTMSDKKQIETLKKDNEKLKNDNGTLISQNGSYGRELTTYKNMLSNYPFSLSEVQDVVYQGSLNSASKTEQTYQIWVQTESHFDISLDNLTADADLEIFNNTNKKVLNSEEKPLYKSDCGNKIPESISNFPASAGNSYLIKVKLFKLEVAKSTSYNLKVKRIPNVSEPTPSSAC